ncbi:MAG: FeoB small GTPase domain-containing protein [Methylocystaceae bacterium]
MIVLVGQPNSGKSSVLSRLTGAKVIISNYPGTSLELMRGTFTANGRTIEIADTPGVYSLARATAEEVVTRNALNEHEVDIIINVINATDLARGLALTQELMEIGKPILLLVNQVDRLHASGRDIDYQRLAHLLGIPAFPFSALTGEGMLELLKFFERGEDKRLSRAGGDAPSRLIMENTCCSGNCAHCGNKPVSECGEDPAIYRHERARQLAAQVLLTGSAGQRRWLERVQTLVDHPVIGPIILILLAYLGFKVLVGFATFAETNVSSFFTPAQLWLEQWIIKVMPHGFITHVLSKSLPEGMLIPFALVMPAMLMISLLMSLLEDTGLLPRYAVVLERVGSLFGVSGQAVIPLSLGFGCRTPAVVATRMLANQDERFIIITLLSIVIPCAATIGILTSVAAKFNAHWLVIVLTMVSVFALLGLLLKRRYGTESDLVYELPPLRLPLAVNVWAKIKMRFAGFFTEVLPLLLFMSIAVRSLIESGWLGHLQAWEKITQTLFGIPAQAFIAVLITIIQKYLAPLVLLNLTLTPREATIAIAMIALSMPCLPVMVMTWREAGGRALVKIAGLGLLVSFIVGIVLNLVLPV